MGDWRLWGAHLEDGLPLMCVGARPLLKEGVQQELPDMDDCEAGICRGLLHGGPPLVPPPHQALQALYTGCGC